MKTALALRHVAFEDLGLLEPLLRLQGLEVRYLDLGVHALASAGEPDLLVVLGGPISCEDDAHYPWLADEVALIQRRLASGRPLLGLCLGSQLIARAMGARVRPMGHKEIGLAPVQLTAAGQATSLAALAGQPLLHWHGDQFELPAGLPSLAATALCPHQAFAPHARALALQFHPEVDPARFEQWLIGHGDELVQAGVTPLHLRAEMARQAPGLRVAAQQWLRRWLSEVGLSETDR